MKKLLVAALLFTAGFSMSAHAGLISGPITFDGGKSVDLQGLEWLPVTYTAGLSRVDVESGFSDDTKMWGTGGWRYATRSEAERLLGSLWGGRYDGWSYDNFAGAATFLELFGATSGAGRYSYAQFTFGAAGDCSPSVSRSCVGVVSAYAAYDSEIYALEFINNAWTLSLASRPGQSIGYFYDESGVATGRSTNNFVERNDLRTSYTGSLLVRSVDAPAALSLFALGLCGLLLRRRQIAA